VFTLKSSINSRERKTWRSEAAEALSLDAPKRWRQADMSALTECEQSVRLIWP
jgi:hypothetical protein